MGLEVYWYDFVCFGIVGVSCCCALWVILRYEGSSSSSPVSSWKGVHPKWLFFTRSLSLLVLAAFLAWDIHDWDASIFIYYTEYILLYMFICIIRPFNPFIIIYPVLDHDYLRRWTFTLVMIYFAVRII